MATNIIYLYSELVGYQIPIINEYINTYGATVSVVHWDQKKLKPFTPTLSDGVIYYKRSEYTKSSLLELCNHIKPDIVYVSGWMDKDYLFVCKKLKKRGVPVVSGFDDMWHGNLRQRVGALVFPFLYKRYFSHAWVAGAYQFEFAKHLGFKNDEIIFDLLSANTNIFNEKKYNRNVDKPAFLYVGNFRKVKGIDILLKAFEIYKNELNGKWQLICVGNGEYEDILQGIDGITVHGYADEERLIEIANKASVFILPSRHDQWGVVVHEFSSLGMPLLLSEFVGARTSFLIEGYNGFIFKENSARELAEKMLQFSNMSILKINEMSHNSSKLGSRISIASSAANFMSLIRK